MQRLQIFIVAAVLLLPSIPELAFGSESMRCGRHIITSGMRTGATQYEVLKKCGEPQSRIGLTWVYDSPGAAPRQITFDGTGRVMRIERLNR